MIDLRSFAHGGPPHHLNHASSPPSPPSLPFGELSFCELTCSSLLTVKTLTGMTTVVYPRENCIFW
jgi:hypothetical protein